jgi:hypothetical protein
MCTATAFRVQVSPDLDESSWKPIRRKGTLSIDVGLGDARSLPVTLNQRVLIMSFRAIGKRHITVGYSLCRLSSCFTPLTTLSTRSAALSITLLNTQYSLPISRSDDGYVVPLEDGSERGFYINHHPSTCSDRRQTPPFSSVLFATAKLFMESGGFKDEDVET